MQVVNGGPIPHSLEILTRAVIIRDADGASTRCPYREFRAYGFPLAGFGLPGDIYLNTMPGSHDLYARYAMGWTKWPGPENVQITLVHPSIPDRHLWFKSDMSSFGWYPRKSLFIHPPGQSPTSSELLSLILKEQARLAEISATKKRRRKNAEDLPGSSNPAKKSKLGPSTDLSAVNTGLPSTSHPPGPQTSAYPAVPAPPLTYQQVSSSSKTGSAVEADVSSGSYAIAAPSNFSGNPSDRSGTSNVVHKSSTSNSGFTSAFEEEISRLRKENQILRKCLSTYNPHLLDDCDQEANKCTEEQENHIPSPKTLEIQDLSAVIPHSDLIQQSVAYSTLTIGQDTTLASFQPPHTSPDCRKEVPDDTLPCQSSDPHNSCLPSSKYPTPTRSGAPSLSGEIPSPTDLHAPSHGPEIIESTALNVVASLPSPPHLEISMPGSSSCNAEFEKRTPSAETIQLKTPLVNETELPVVGTTHQLNQSHITIMFHTSASDMICRLCLQKKPRVVFHVKTSSTFDRLNDHCKKEHPDMCDHLLAMTDTRLSELNRRLSARTRNV